MTTPLVLHRSMNLSALGTMLWLTVRQLVRGKRLVILAALFSLPALVAILARNFGDPSERMYSEMEIALAFALIPHALVPLTALLYATGMVQDEIEEQTLTYLLVRPLPKWSIYLAKLLGVLFVSILLTIVFTFVTYLAIYWNTADFWDKNIPLRALKTGGIFGLALFGYCTGFGVLSLIARRSMVLGVAYTVLFEGVVANIDFMVRRMTVMYYVRVLQVRWLGVDGQPWSIDLRADPPPPSVETCLLTLLAVSVVGTLLAMVVFSGREFRVKTPEGN